MRAGDWSTILPAEPVEFSYLLGEYLERVWVTLDLARSTSVPLPIVNSQDDVLGMDVEALLTTDDVVRKHLTMVAEVICRSDRLCLRVTDLRHIRAHRDLQAPESPLAQQFGHRAFALLRLLGLADVRLSTGRGLKVLMLAKRPFPSPLTPVEWFRTQLHAPNMNEEGNFKIPLKKFIPTT